MDESQQGPHPGRICLERVLEDARAGDDLDPAWYRTDPPGVPLDRWRQALARLGEAIAGQPVVHREFPEPRLAIAVFAGPGGRAFRLAVAADVVEGRPRVRTMASIPVPEGVAVREATPADAPALRRLESEIPVVTGDVAVTVDRGEDYFAGERLMGTARTFVVERDGRVTGLQSTAINTIRVAGEDRLATYLHRLRLLPEARGSGAAWYLNERCWEATGWQTETQYGLVAAGNEAARAFYRGQAEWPVQPVRLVVPARRGPGTSPGRPATPADAPRIVDMLNATHRAEELFVPYTIASLSERLSREPAVYGWNALSLTGHAVVGTWMNAFIVARDAAGVRRQLRRTLVLDYGCEPGHEAELAALVAAVAAEAGRAGSDEVSVFTSPPSPGYRELVALSERVEPYLVFCTLAPGPGLETRGVYVDHVYV